MNKKLLGFALAIFSTLFVSKSIRAADIRVEDIGDASYGVVVIEGKIEQGDFEKFLSLIAENNGRIGNVYIFSSGGDFREAMKIGRAMRALELSSMVPMKSSSGRPECGGYLVPVPKDPNNCVAASAGFFIHIGAVHRGGNFLAVHRPSFEQSRFGELSEQDAQKAFDALQAQARVYMSEMGVPTHIQEDVLGTPSDKALILDEKIIKTYFWGDLPSRHEWLIAKCSNLPAPPADSKYYGKPGSLKWRMAQADPSNAKFEQERDCLIALVAKSRVSAYVNYFGKGIREH